MPNTLKHLETLGMPWRESRMNINSTKRALTLWGEYMNAPVMGGKCKGYPSQSCVLSEGISKQKRAPMISAPSNLVKEVDVAMKLLSSTHPMLFMALKYKYEDNQIEKEAAKSMNISRSLYQNKVSSGEMFVFARILK